MSIPVDDAPGGRSAALEGYRLATAWFFQGHLDRARAKLEQLTDRYPEFIPASLDLGQLLLQAGDRESARAVYARALVASPGDASLRSRFDQLNREPPRRTASANEHVPVGALGHILLYTDCPGIHGVEQTSHLLACGLVRAGYRVTYAQSRASHHLIQEREEIGIQHRWIEADNLYDPSRTPRAFSNHTEARQVFASVRPDLIIFANGSPFSNLAAEETAAELGLPHLLVTHCVTAAWAEEHPQLLPRLGNVYQRAHAVIAVCHENLELLRDRFGLPENRGQVIYPARRDVFFLPPDMKARHHIRTELGIPEDGVVCLTVARMEHMKGYQYQLQAIAELRRRPSWEKIYFIWAGSGTMEGRLRARLIELGLADHVKFAGERADIQVLFDAADLFVLPSEFEGMPGVIMEAQAKRLPVLASAVSGIPEEMGNTGKLLPNPRSDPTGVIRELVETIDTWAQDSRLRSRIGSHAAARARALFRAGQMIDKYVGLVEQARRSVEEPA